MSLRNFAPRACVSLWVGMVVRDGCEVRLCDACDPCVHVSRVSLVPAPPGVFLPVHLSAKSCERVSCIDIKSCRSHCVLSVVEI